MLSKFSSCLAHKKERMGNSARQVTQKLNQPDVSKMVKCKEKINLYSHIDFYWFIGHVLKNDIIYKLYTALTT